MLLVTLVVAVTVTVTDMTVVVFDDEGDDVESPENDVLYGS